MAGMDYFDSNRRNTVILKFEAVNVDALVVAIPSIEKSHNGSFF
jgi:actin-related protein